VARSHGNRVPARGRFALWPTTATVSTQAANPTGTTGCSQHAPSQRLLRCIARITSFDSNLAARGMSFTLHSDQQPPTVTVLEPGLFELSQNATACTCPNSPSGIDVCTCTSLFHSEGNEGGVIVRGPGATLRIRCFQAMCGYFGAVCGGACVYLAC
jgi:hypothetical protein